MSNSDVICTVNHRLTVALWADQDEKDDTVEITWRGDEWAFVSVSNIVLAADGLCLWVGSYMYKLWQGLNCWMAANCQRCGWKRNVTIVGSSWRQTSNLHNRCSPTRNPKTVLSGYEKRLLLLMCLWKTAEGRTRDWSKWRWRWRQ